jgi:hypothetical protein
MKNPIAYHNDGVVVVNLVVLWLTPDNFNKYFSF